MQKIYSYLCANETGKYDGSKKYKSGSIKIGDYKVEDYQYLQYYLYRYQIGDTVEIVLIRDGKEKTIKVELKG